MTTVAGMRPNDTYDMYIDARRFGVDSFTYGLDSVSEEADGWMRVSDWSVNVFNPIEKSWTSVTHETVLEAMHVISQGISGANEVTSALVRSVVTAGTEEALADGLAALETRDHSVILEVAVCGQAREVF